MKKVKWIIVGAICTNLITGAFIAEAKEKKAPKEDENIVACFSFRKAQEYDRAIDSGKKAIKSSPKSFDSHFCLGTAYKKVGELKLALVELKKADSLAKTKIELANVSSYMGDVNDAMGNSDEAFRLFNRALNLSRELDDQSGVASALNNIAGVYFDKDQKDKALEYWRDSLAAEPDELRKTATYNNIAMLLSTQGKFEEAHSNIRSAISISERSGDYHAQAKSLSQLAYIQYAEKNYQAAKETYLDALKKIREVKDIMSEGAILQRLGWVCSNLGEKPLAAEYLKQAQAIFTRNGAQSAAKEVQMDLDRLQQ